MTKIENRCCNCAVGAYPCLGSSCPNRRVEVVYCDFCGCEIGDPRDANQVDGKDACNECYEKEEF